jgi:lanthanide-dependent methanol dehydrogenase
VASAQARCTVEARLGLDPRDLTAGNGWGNAMQDLSSRTQKGGALYVFALP